MTILMLTTEARGTQEATGVKIKVACSTFTQHFMHNYCFQVIAHQSLYYNRVLGMQKFKYNHFPRTVNIKVTIHL